MIELSITLAIAAMLLVIVLTMAQSTRDSGKGDAAGSNFATIAAGTRKAYGGSSSYSGISAEALIELGVIPGKMANDSEIVDDWGNSVEVASTSINSGSSNAVLFTYQAVPRAACAGFVNAAANSAEIVSVDGTSVKDSTSSQSTVDTSSLASACDANSGGTAEVEFTVGR